MKALISSIILAFIVTFHPNRLISVINKKLKKFKLNLIVNNYVLQIANAVVADT